MSEGYKKIIAWKKSYDLVLLIYKITKCFPKEEMFVLVPQIRRAVISISANIAEGYEKSTKEYIHYLSISRGSARELETLLFLSKDLGYISQNVFEETNKLLDEVCRLLSSFIKSLKQ